MAVIEVEYDGNVEDLQQDLDDADLQAEVDVEGDAPGGAAGGTDEQGGALPGGRSAIVGAIIAVAGLLTPIKEILEGIRNFFLLTLAPVFTALRPLFDFLRDTLLQISQFLSGDITFEELIGDLADGVITALKNLVNQIASSLDQNIGFVDIGTPFPDAQGRQGGQARRTGTRENQGNPIETLARSNPTAFAGITIGQALGETFLADRSGEAQKEARANELQKFRKTFFGADAGQTGEGT